MIIIGLLLLFFYNVYFFEMSSRYHKKYPPPKTSRLNFLPKDFSNPLSEPKTFDSVLRTVKLLSRESGNKSYPYIELLTVKHPEKNHEWYTLRFPVIRTSNPELSLEWEYFTLGYDPYYKDIHGNGTWWFIFSGYMGSCYAHPFIKNPFHDDLGKPFYGCIIIQDSKVFLSRHLRSLLYDYTMNMPLDENEEFTV